MSYLAALATVLLSARLWQSKTTNAQFRKRRADL